MTAAFERWRAGFGPIRHAPATVERLLALVARRAPALPGGPERAWRVLAAADRVACATLSLVAHMTYARRVDPGGAPLPAEAFKASPEGHTGGSLNMAVAHVGRMAADALSGHRRAWVMGQGHCVAAIEAGNLLTGQTSEVQAARYDRSPAGIERFLGDFYGYGLAPDGQPSAPLGSHVGPWTQGGVLEGGYLGFAEVQYVHMPLPDERLVAFLSDGAFEEQRGADWSPRWWRASDCGLVTPVMILNGRRIEQRTEIAQDGGAAWLGRHLRLNGFDPIAIDGRDPAAFAWAVIEAETRLERRGRAGRYPARLPYVVAETVKGWGFPGAGTNRAHNLPLEGNPARDPAAREAFNAAAARLFVPTAELDAAIAELAPPAAPRPALDRRDPPAPMLPPADPCPGAMSPMAAIDAWFVRFVDANPGHRFRVGNPDELASNQMGATLRRLKHRVARPEPGTDEAVDGAVVTALNEEAAIGAALGAKGGLNLAVTYEAFAPKMLGAIRQEVIFARRAAEIGRPARWIGVPVLATSHTWENGKNEQSHQDPTFAEALMGEMGDVARVLFPPDAASAVEAIRDVYAGRGVVAALVTPKRPVPARFDGPAAAALVRDGAAVVAGDPAAADLQLVAVGAYQLTEALRAAGRLEARGVRACVAAIVEPGRLRIPRDAREGAGVQDDAFVRRLFPPGLPRVIVAHTRPEPMLGVLRRLDGGPARTRALGYRNRGGTLDTFGMLFANGCAWAHAVVEAADLLGADPARLLDPPELAAVRGRGDPRALR